MPPQAIQYMNNMGKDTDNIAIYLLQTHFPWMPLTSPSVVGTCKYGECNQNHYITLYKQAYLATMNNADPVYQKIYDSHIQPILMDLIGQYFWQNQKIDYLNLYNYIKRRPNLVQDMIHGNFNVDITLEAIQLNSDYDDMEYRGGDIELDQEHTDLFPPMNIRNINNL